MIWQGKESLQIKELRGMVWELAEGIAKDKSIKRNSPQSKWADTIRYRLRPPAPPKPPSTLSTVPSPLVSRAVPSQSQSQSHSYSHTQSQSSTYSINTGTGTGTGTISNLSSQPYNFGDSSDSADNRNKNRNKNKNKKKQKKANKKDRKRVSTREIVTYESPESAKRKNKG